MTVLLEKALNRVESLSPEEQDAIAAQIIGTLDDDKSWECFYAANADKFQVMADEAIAEHERGETRPIEELLNE